MVIPSQKTETMNHLKTLTLVSMETKTASEDSILDKLSVASSQALPALKVAIDDECSGKGLVFTKNNQPVFGLLFLAQFARFFDSY